MNQYFSHDSTARNSDKLIGVRMKHGAAGYGVYFMILERLRDEPDYMSVKDYNMLAFDFRVDAGLVKGVVEDFGLFVFTEDGKCFYSESFMNRMAMKDAKSQRLSEAGKKGASKRWEKNKNSQAIAEASSKIARKDSKENTEKERNNRERVTKEVEDIIIYASDNFGRELSPLEQEELQALSQKHQPVMVKEAIRRTVLNKKETLSYVQGILSKWEQQGIKELEALSATDSAWKHQKKRGGSPGMRRESLPDWAKKDEEVIETPLSNKEKEMFQEQLRQLTS